MPKDGSDLEDFNARVSTELNWIPVSSRLQGKKYKMQSIAQDWMDIMKDQLKQTRKRKKQTNWNVMKTAPRVVAEVKNKMSKIS